MADRAQRKKGQDLQKARESDLWDDAVQWAREELGHQELEKVRVLHGEDPEEWWAPFHYGWGMAFRNALRDHGFGEDDFDIVNLDNIYVDIVEEAAGV